MHKAVCRVATKRLLNKSLQTHKEHVGSLLKACRLIKSLQIDGKDDFGKGCHTASTEPYYDSATSWLREITTLPKAREILSENELYLLLHNSHPPHITKGRRRSFLLWQK